jgi:hypothetical protein
MNVDFRLFRRAARATCSAALVGSLFGGCASLHKPRFWDKGDVASTSDTTASPPNGSAAAATSTTPPAAPTVVAADHSTPADSTSGQASAYDFPDASPSDSSGQSTLASDSLPAPVEKPGPVPSRANDPFADTSEPPVISTRPAQSPVASVASVPAASASGQAAATPNPFAETDDPVFATGTQSRPSANSPATVGTLPPTPATQPGTTATTSPPRSATSLPATAAKSPPASPEPEWSAQSDAVTSSETAPKKPVPAAPKSTAVAATTHTDDGYDAFGDPAPPTSAKAPLTPPRVEATDKWPNCAAPTAAAVAPPQTAAATPATPPDPAAAKPANSAAWTPARAPASLEQAPPAKAVTAAPKPAASVEKVSAAKATSDPDWDVEKPQPAVQSQAAVADTMICDSRTVRGRFTGISRKAVKVSPQVEPLFQQTAPAAVPSASAAPAPVKAAPPKPPEQPAVPLPSAEAVKPAPQPTQAAKAADQTAREPAKPTSGVVHAVAQQVGQPSALDPFTLEQTVDNSPAEAINPAHSPAPPKAESAPPLSADEPPFDPASIQLADAAPLVAPNPPRESASMPVETWFAIGMGMGIGLAATLGLWLRLRRKAAPSANDEGLKAAA